MKVIDLLNKIANGEEIKAKLKFKLGDIIINYYGMNNYSRTPEYDIAYIDKGCTTHYFTLGTLIKSLNDEVEIIEDNKIEHCRAYCSFTDYIYHKDKIDNKEMFLKDLQESMFSITKSLDEVIDYLNEVK